MEQMPHMTKALREAISRIPGVLGRLPSDTPAVSALTDLASEARKAATALEQLLRMTPDILLIAGSDGAIAMASDRCRAVLGYDPAELDGFTVADLLVPDDRTCVAEAIARVGTGTPGHALQTRWRRRDGEVVSLEWTGVGSAADGFLFAVLRDLTTQKQYEQLLRESEQLYEALFDHSPDAVFSVDREGRVVSLNSVCASLLGYQAQEILGRPLYEFLDPASAEKGQEALRQVMDGMPRDAETIIRQRDGHTRTMHVTLVPMNLEGRIVGGLGVARDITDRKQAEEQLAHLAYHDPLTGLANRTLFMTRLEQGLDRAVRNQPSLALLYLDLDDFKIVNDSLGHRAGDALLVEAARRLKACVRPSDTVARLGGDEFTVLLEGIEDTPDAVMVAHRILETLREPYLIDGHKVVATPSVGVVMGNQGQDAKELLRYADIAMYRAKQNGKARYEAFTPVMYEHVLQRLQLETDLRRAIEKQEFQLWYQPIIELATGNISGMEALIRWEDPERGLISPAEFIPLAEETGLILPIGKWVLEQACRQAQAWQVRYPDLVVSVNLSGRQFQEPFLALEVERVLQESGLEPRGLQLEITETVLMKDAAMAQDTLRELKALGIQLAMDDFGTGYSSLSYLKHFPIDVLKIDRSFVKELGNSPQDEAMVQTVVWLARALNLKVTGEGVETAEQAAHLRNMACERGQGYLFARPLLPEQVEVLLDSGRHW
ncbi:MAG TPA: EAL domain-containing protein [Symbiobacteriaceae bacterium]|jgi:diguanylate cyclase (GGDEF)-like protein/PAS domain S-box-containing protein|nr:EAL domain-containing protein [Symbiobacteriaceae bacterium]